MELQLQALATTRRSDQARFERAHKTSDPFSRLTFQHTKPQLKPLYSTPVLKRLSGSAGRGHAVKGVIFTGIRGIKRSAAKVLAELPKADRVRVVEAIDLLCDTPAAGPLPSGLRMAAHRPGDPGGAHRPSS